MGMPIVVGLSGASGTVYGVRLLEILRELDIPTHVVATKAAILTMTQETAYSVGDVQRLSTHWHPIGDIGASIASGSFETRGMIIAPCSMNTVASIASGMTTNLLTRAADVALKERRRLVLVARESPLHLVHLRNLVTVTELGAIVAPPVPAFYARPRTLDEMIGHTVGRILQLFGLDTQLVTPWRGDVPPATRREAADPVAAAANAAVAASD